MTLRIVITGKDGQIVSALKEQGAGQSDVKIISLGRPELDLAQPDTIEDAIRDADPDVIISAAAYTAVDKAEAESDLAQVINGVAPGELARVARLLNVPILHLSTDYVFDGTKDAPYTEEDRTGPVSVYGRTKLDGERAIAEATDNHVILRTAWVYSPFGSNFVKTMLRLAETRETLDIVDDQRGCPTSALDIAAVLLLIARQVVNDPDPTLRGVFNLAAPDDASWAEFAAAIFAGLEKRGGKSVTVNPIPSSQYPTPAQRPANSRLSGEKLLEIYGLQLDPWQLSLDSCLDRLIG